MKIDYLRKLINDVGMSTFVKYYYEFKQGDRARAILSIQENYTPKSKGTRTSKAFKIFEENLNLHILELIMQASRVDNSIRERAKTIYLSEKEIVID